MFRGFEKNSINRADPQANATSSLVLDSGKLAGTYQLINQTITASELIIETTSPNLEIIPSSIDLVGIEIELVDKENREKMLTEALEPIKVMIIFLLTAHLH